MRRFVALTLPVLTALALVPAARADLLPPAATHCAPESTAPVFRPWLDPDQYTLSPGASFEHGRDGWTGGTVRSGNEPFHVDGAGDRDSLRVAAGATATSPTVCVGIDHPTLRLFARSLDAPVAPVRVDVEFWGPAGLPLRVPMGVVAVTRKWEPSPPLVIPASLLPLLPDRRTPVAFALVPQGRDATVAVDDVYVDPYKKG